MKCPKCGFDKIQPNYKFCPKCRTSLIAESGPSSIFAPSPVQQSYASKNPDSSPRIIRNIDINGIQSVNHKLIWNIREDADVIARYISPKELENIADFKGVVVDNCSAVICLDGSPVAEISNGTYNFLSDEEVNRIIERTEREYNDRSIGLLGHVNKFLRKVVTLVTGEREGEKEQERNLRQYRDLKAIANNLEKYQNAAIISVYLKRDGIFRTRLGSDGKGNFQQYLIKSKYLDLNIGVELQFRIGDFSSFITNHLAGKQYVRISDIREELNSPVKSILQDRLRDVAIDQTGLSTAVIDALKADIADVAQFVPGIEIVRVIDITSDNEEINKYREQEKALFIIPKKLDQAERTNEFNNRLESIKNKAEIDSATSKEELRLALKKINVDGLLSDDELDLQVERLTVEKKIRNAKNDNEVATALNEVEKSGLLREDEIDAIKADVTNRKIDREQIAEMLRIKAYGLSAKAKALADIETDRIKEEYKDERDVKAVDKEVSILEKRLAGQRMVEDFENARKLHELEMQQRKEMNDLDILARKAAISRESMQALKDAEMAQQAQSFSHEERMAQQKIDADSAKMSFTRQMTAEQIMAMNIAGLEGEAQKAFAESFAAGKNAKQTEDLYKQMLEMQQTSSDKNAATQMEMMKMMMELAKNGNATAAAVAAGKMQDLKESKDEYRIQMEHEQKRLDETQDKALNYTTKANDSFNKNVAKTVISVNGKNGRYETTTRKYVISEFGEEEFAFENVASYIANGIVTPKTEFVVDGEIVEAVYINELYPLLAKYYTSVCKNCGTKGLKGTFCPECGEEI